MGLEDIRRERGRKSGSVVAGSLTTSMLMMTSFAVGAALGPAPLLPGELIAGGIFSTLVGLGVGLVFARKRLEEGAEIAMTVLERGKKSRLSIFGEYFTLNGQVILRSRLRAATLTGDRLELSYVSGDTEDDVTRTALFGDSELLKKARVALARED